MVTEHDVSLQKIPILECICCNYITDNKKDFNKHLLTRKHEFKIKSTEKNENITNIVTIGDKKSQKSQQHTCMSCNKMYKSRNGLWLHKKKMCNRTY